MEATAYPPLPVSVNGHRYGLFRDNPYAPARMRLALPESTVALPPKADIWKYKGLTRDQGQEGSCTGQMGAEIIDALYRQFKMYEGDQSIDPAKFLASAEFVYLCNLIADGDLGQDAGSSIHQTFITLDQKGACLNSQMPYHDTDYSKAPSATQYAEALRFRVGAYHSLPNLRTMKQAIASGYSFGAGIDVYESFEGDWNSTGLMPMPNVNQEQLLGGHAQHFMAYDDTLQFPAGHVGGFGVQNSWGNSWGVSAPGHSDGGCYWMPYDFVLAGLLTDAWVAHLGKPWK